MPREGSLREILNTEFRSLEGSVQFINHSSSRFFATPAVATSLLTAESRRNAEILFYGFFKYFTLRLFVLSAVITTLRSLQVPISSFIPEIRYASVSACAVYDLIKWLDFATVNIKKAL